MPGADPPRPRVSVVVFTHDAVSTLAPALRSLAAQDGIDEAEVIVADGTRDGAAAAACAGLPGVVHLALGPGNMPALKAAAMARARGDVIAVLDPADTAEPGWLREMVRGLETTGAAVIG